jgi:hypothetical protein
MLTPSQGMRSAFDNTHAAQGAVRGWVLIWPEQVLLLVEGGETSVVAQLQGGGPHFVSELGLPAHAPHSHCRLRLHAGAGCRATQLAAEGRHGASVISKAKDAVLVHLLGLFGHLRLKRIHIPVIIFGLQFTTPGDCSLEDKVLDPVGPQAWLGEFGVSEHLKVVWRGITRVFHKGGSFFGSLVGGLVAGHANVCTDLVNVDRVLLNTHFAKQLLGNRSEESAVLAFAQAFRLMDRYGNEEDGSQAVSHDASSRVHAVPQGTKNGNHLSPQYRMQLQVMCGRLNAASLTSGRLKYA